MKLEAIGEFVVLKESESKLGSFVMSETHKGEVVSVGPDVEGIDVGDGTYLFDKNKKCVKKVEWKVNRAFIFKGVPNVTWHSYANTKDTPRLTVNYF